MKRIKIILTVLIIFPNGSFAQNMLLNNGFEAYSVLPSGPGEWWKVNGWNNVNNQSVFGWPYASPDYLSTNGTGQAHLPGSVFGTVNPYAGNAVMGFVAYYGAGAADFREYISRPLTTPLVVGQKYTISFMMTNGNSNQYCGSGCDHIGIYFSINPLTQINHEPINVTPQCEITTVWWNTTWQLITFTYTATAAFQYFTLGNFYNDASTAHTVFNASSPSSYGAYYFIDEMAVQLTTPLPVELVSFTGEKINNMNHLMWTTASEINNDYFEVENSTVEKIFEKIGTIKGNGNSTQFLDYDFDDRFPAEGINYYRLKQVDFNGEYKYSQVITLKNKPAESACSIYSSGEDGIYFLNCNVVQPGNVYVSDMRGTLIREINIKNPNSLIKIDLSGCSVGMYIIKFYNGKVYRNIKLIKG